MLLPCYQDLEGLDERVKRVLAKTPLIDGHNDLPQQPRAIFHGKIHNNPKFDLENGFERGMTDIPRLRTGKSSSSLCRMRLSNNR
jgi:membrane dipeptidase